MGRCSPNGRPDHIDRTSGSLSMEEIQCQNWGWVFHFFSLMPNICFDTYNLSQPAGFKEGINVSYWKFELISCVGILSLAGRPAKLPTLHLKSI